MNALDSWTENMSGKAPTTVRNYIHYFKRFSAWAGRDADEIVSLRRQDLAASEPVERKRFENLAKKYDRVLMDGGASYSQRVMVRNALKSFFEAHELDLKIKPDDAPKGEYGEERAATKDEIKKMFDVSSVRERAVLMFLKDTGLRVGDAAALNVGDVDLYSDFPMLKVVTQKEKIIAKTFLGPESQNSLINYFESREGHFKEAIGPEAPLFRKNCPKITRLKGWHLSNSVSRAVETCGFSGISAHSLRRFYETSLEAGGVHPTWVDRLVGHKPQGSRNSYSKPTDDQLRDAYIKAYPNLQVLEPVTNHERLEGLESKMNEKDKENAELKQHLNELSTQLAKNDQVLVAMESFLSKLPSFIGSVDGKPGVIKDAEFTQALKDFRKALEPKR